MREVLWRVTCETTIGDVGVIFGSNPWWEKPWPRRLGLMAVTITMSLAVAMSVTDDDGKADAEKTMMAAAMIGPFVIIAG